MSNDHRDGYKRIAYVFQGGGALGAFQVGAYKALLEKNYQPDWICGISIGAINTAIIAGNPPEKRWDKLHQFWQKISVNTSPFHWLYSNHFPKIHNQISANLSMMFGLDGFIKPRIFNPWFIQSDTPDNISFYDPAPLYESLNELIDFDYLNNGLIRISLGAVDVETGLLIYFDNQKIHIKPEHVIASGALPPSMPAVKINGRYYWDGGVHSNTPLSLILDDTPRVDTLVFMVDNFSGKGVTPHSMDGVLERAKDIRFSSHSQRHTRLHMTRHNLRRAIAKIEDKLTEEQKKDPEIQRILELGCTSAIHIAHLIYRSPTGTELHSKDYEFSDLSIDRRLSDGYQHTLQMINDNRSDWIESVKSKGIKIYTEDKEEPYAEELK